MDDPILSNNYLQTLNKYQAFEERKYTSSPGFKFESPQE